MSPLKTLASLLQKYKKALKSQCIRTMSLLSLLIILHHIIKFPSNFIDFRKDFLIQNLCINLGSSDVCMTKHFRNALDGYAFGQHKGRK